MKREPLARITSNTPWLYAAEFIPRLVAIFVVPIWSARVSPAEYGRWVLALSTVELVLETSGLGLATFLTKVIYRYRDDRVSRYFGMGATVALGVTAAAAVGMVVASPWLSRTIIGDDVRPELFAVLGVYLVCAQFNGLAALYTGAAVRYRAYFALTMTRWLVGTPLLLVFVIVFQQGFYSWVWSALSAEIVLLPMAAWQLRGMRWGWRRRPLLSFALRFSGPTLATNFMGWVHNRVGRYVLSFTGLAAGVGLYGVAQNFAGNYGAVVRPAKIVALRVVGHALEDDADSPYYMEFFHSFSCVALAVAFLVALFVGDVMRLFVSPSYYAAAAALPILVFALYGNELYSLYGSLMFRYFKVWFHFWGSLVGFGTVVIGSLLLIPRFGLRGAAIAQFLGSAAYVIFAHLYAGRMSPRSFRLGEKAAFSLIGLAVAVAVEDLGLSVTTKIVVAVVALASYVALHWSRRSQLFPGLAGALAVHEQGGRVA